MTVKLILFFFLFIHKSARMKITLIHKFKLNDYAKAFEIYTNMQLAVFIKKTFF